MLSKPDVEVVYDAEGVVTGVKSNNEKGEPETAVTKLVVGDPSALIPTQISFPQQRLLAVLLGAESSRIPCHRTMLWQ